MFQPYVENYVVKLLLNFQVIKWKNKNFMKQKWQKLTNLKIFEVLYFTRKCSKSIKTGIKT